MLDRLARLYKAASIAGSCWSCTRRSRLRCGSTSAAWATPVGLRRPGASRPGCWTRSCSPRTRYVPPLARRRVDHVVRSGRRASGDGAAAGGDARRRIRRRALVMPTVRRRATLHPSARRDAAAASSACCIAAKATACPTSGESDMGLFALSAMAYLELLPAIRTGGRSRPPDRRAQLPAVHPVAGRPARRRDVPVGRRRWRPSASTRRRNSRSSKRYLGRRVTGRLRDDAVDRHSGVQRRAIHRNAARSRFARSISNRSGVAQRDHRRRRLLEGSDGGDRRAASRASGCTGRPVNGGKGQGGAPGHRDGHRRAT